MSMVSTTTVPHIRKTREGMDIVARNKDILLNSKKDFLQGAVPSWYWQLICGNQLLSIFFPFENLVFGTNYMIYQYASSETIRVYKWPRARKISSKYLTVFSISTPNLQFQIKLPKRNTAVVHVDLNILSIICYNSCIIIVWK